MNVYGFNNSLVLNKQEFNTQKEAKKTEEKNNIHSSIKDALNLFNSISLAEIDQIKLMSRVDAKFVFPIERLPELLRLASGQYKVLEINGSKAMPYTSVYMDTSNYLLYNQHLCGKSNRFKVRYRTYETTKETFLEVKCMTSKKRTEKSRIQNKLENENPDEMAMQFLSKYLNEVAEELVPFFKNKFYRITLAGLESKERITLDFNIKFRGFDETAIDLPFLAIAEVKKEGYSSNSPFMNLLKGMQIRSTGFSKYCIGNVLLRKMPKGNLLKPKLLMLQKIKHENSLLATA